MSFDYSLEQIREIVAAIATEFDVEKIALFGSYARGEQTETSDLDFLIEKGGITGYFQLARFIERLEEELDRSVDVITYNSLQDSLLAGTSLNEVVIYERTGSEDSFKDSSVY